MTRPRNRKRSAPSSQMQAPAGAALTEQERIPADVKQQLAAQTLELRAVHQALRAAIAEHQRAEEEARRLAAIVESSDDAIIGMTLNGVITTWNTGAVNVYGYTAAEAVGRPYLMLVPADLAADLRHVHQRVRRGERVQHFETRRLRKDGQEITVSLSASPILNAVGHVIGISSIARDTSERKTLERRALEIAIEEQRRIGQDLHDTTGQELAGLLLMALSLEESLQERTAPDAPLAAKITEGLKRALNHVRGLARGLVPVQVDADGLMAALEEMAQRIHGLHGIRCRFECSQPVRIKDNFSATHLYHIAQEAVTNALKHAQPAAIEIRLAADERLVTLRIQDDGTGITAQATPAKGMGLQIMRYRASLIHATLTVEPGKAGGTVLTCSLLKGDHHAPEQGPARETTSANPDRG